MVGKTGLVTLAGTGAVETFPAHIPVQENDILGFWAPTGTRNVIRRVTHRRRRNRRLRMPNPSVGAI